ncbi:hypothetical protein AA0113_g9632 [Alternaria arborescens]|jgi:hypothetical protein|uniref:Uncharacterized protein n=3 Tax=Alternaria sect. Alternaria TaxID=2499237 RepID=A0A4Q4MQF5_9PLEO|nr:hypothetical protein AA0111_g5440 [Alternaria arborescens]KAB2111280.1 hypothetical protein AG0111_0g870 [Alternaria gaisen]RYN34569.1 hypothetical protein AA0115_g2704 [Alternaria tenuissima]RYN46973.1 hypothetical protein AA0118_g12366 [Alternaria tenuissima]RYN55817.1 hypothetical protein AA0114_g3079 [Alternaria tenuissima]RYO16771.1 hypothetical protein AA0121_g6247 [Alternaria tenuissima]
MKLPAPVLVILSTVLMFFTASLAPLIAVKCNVPQQPIPAYTLGSCVTGTWF